jgi:hypothetical protein
MMFYFSSKSAARGFRNFQNYRPAIPFHCGRLDLLPRPEIASATLFQEEPFSVTERHYAQPSAVSNSRSARVEEVLHVG